MDDQLAAARAAQAARWAAQPPPAVAPSGASRRKGAAPQRHGTGRGRALAADVPAEAEAEEPSESEPPTARAAALSALEATLAPPKALPTAKRRRVTARSVEALAAEYHTNAEGGTAAERLQRQGDVEARLAAKPAFEVLPGRLVVRYKALRTQLEESVQALSRAELLQLLAEVGSRGSKRRATATAHLLAPREMAGRSPVAFWNAFHLFGGVDAAVAAARAAAA